MFCSNCGSTLPPNGICTQCGVPATNMTFTGYTQGAPVVPQQQFYNPNPMYVQYQGQPQGYIQPVYQDNVAIAGIKDPRILGNIGRAIKDASGSIVTVIFALVSVLAVVFCFVEMIDFTGIRSLRYETDFSILYVMYSLFSKVAPFVLLLIGAWMIVFHGYSAYKKKWYDDMSSMNTSGFTLIQSSGIVNLIFGAVPAIFIVVAVMIILVEALAGSGEYRYMDGFDFFMLIMMVATAIVQIIMCIALIANMSKIKNALRMRNYDRISIFVIVILILYAICNATLGIGFIAEEIIFVGISKFIYALLFSMGAVFLGYMKGKINTQIPA